MNLEESKASIMKIVHRLNFNAPIVHESYRNQKQIQNQEKTQ